MNSKTSGLKSQQRLAKIVRIEREAHEEREKRGRKKKNHRRAGVRVFDVGIMRWDSKGQMIALSVIHQVGRLINMEGTRSW